MSDLNYKIFPEYTIDTISNAMSLRIPQKESIKILDNILDSTELSKIINLENAKNQIHGVYPIFSDFEHSFMSLTFALATGVGKTKLMGAFITYLYTNKGVKNFFVIAPNLTIYSKLKNDLGNASPDNEKYVFRGISCFSNAKPNIWVDDDYRNRPAHALGDSDSINIFIFNISKFNSDERKMLSINEYLGESFFDYLKNLEDLVIIMDESHHYRAKASAQAINTLNPVLGIELTATPEVQLNSSTKIFKNVVYEYPLSSAIRDGYTRTPYALARQDFNYKDIPENQLDRIMIGDGLKHHEIIKAKLKEYASSNQVKLVKPFMLIVCKNTEHAELIFNYIKSNEFKNGEYANKVVIVHSNQKGEEKEENIQLLLNVEKNNNPIEIVIHVNILKEGWDVNNLYTIVPLRTATSKVLREQTVGRGLRLPYGVRTGVKEIDSVVLTAHDKFDEIISEAQKSDSIFKAGGVIFAEYEKTLKTTLTQVNLFDDNNQRRIIMQNAGCDINSELDKKAYEKVESSINNVVVGIRKIEPDKKINKEVLKEKVKEDLGSNYTDSQAIQKLVDSAFGVDDVINLINESKIYIPRIKVETLGDEKYIISDFDLDLTNLNFIPLATDIIIKNLLDSREKTEIVKGNSLDLGSIKPEKYLIDNITNISEINYEKCPELIQKLILQFLKYYRSIYKEDDVVNIILGNKNSIINEFRNQILSHLAISYPGLVETIEGVSTNVVLEEISYSGDILDLNTEPIGNIKSCVYNGGSKSLTMNFKFDSNPERIFAQCCEISKEVKHWLRPAKTQFNITYNRGHNYIPDFVVETDDTYYLVEVKARNQMDDPIVLAKKERAIAYCKIASNYNKANNHKPFKYLFIPDDVISATSSFKNLKERFIEN